MSSSLVWRRNIKVKKYARVIYDKINAPTYVCIHVSKSKKENKTKNINKFYISAPKEDL